MAFWTMVAIADDWAECGAVVEVVEVVALDVHPDTTSAADAHHRNRHQQASDLPGFFAAVPLSMIFPRLSRSKSDRQKRQLLTS